MATKVRKQDMMTGLEAMLADAASTAAVLQSQLKSIQAVYAAEEEAEDQEEMAEGEVINSRTIVADVTAKNTNSRWMVGHLSDDEFLRAFKSR